MPIRKLPALLVNQIAAGEVIERPASVVKELVENSLDAGAKRIDVAIEDGGRELIRVSDDGAGIPPEELALAVAPHATSKLQSPEQLADIATLGFRGEALASIASVSRLRLSSRATMDGRTREAGAVIETSAGESSPVAPAAMAPGTVVEVRDLFFNTPARRKFLRAAPTEFGHIDEVIGRIAMAHPEVSFTLSHNGKKGLELAAAASRRQRCVEVLGKELDEALLEFESGPEIRGGERGLADGGDEYDVHVWGLAGLPAIARATGKFQYLCVNGRPIRDRNLTHALKEGYRGLIPPDKQPVAVLFIDLSPRAVDVNVHPAKAEVRFRDPQRLHGLVLTVFRQRLLGSDLTPQAGLKVADLRLQLKEGPLDDAPSATDGTSGASAISSSAFVEYFKRMAPQQKGLVYQEVKRAFGETDPTVLGEGSSGESSMSATAPPAYRSQAILQVHRSYVVTQDEQGIIIVDQHALHERVMFEELWTRLMGPERKLESQRLLMPAVIKASASRLALLETLRPLLDRLGIEVDALGPGAAAVHAFPTFLFDRKVEPVEFMEALLDRAAEGDLDAAKAAPAPGAGFGAAAAGNAVPGSSLEESVLHKVVDMMACKAAVKAGDELTGEELAALLARREQLERGSSCPHGRPTAIRLTLRDLEKHFKRT